MSRSTARIAFAAAALAVAVLMAVGVFVRPEADPPGALAESEAATTSPSPAATAAAATNDDSSTAPATADPTPQWPAVAGAVVSTEDLNVRVGPGTRYAVIGRLQPGDSVPVAGRVLGPWLGLPGIGWVSYSEDWLELSTPIEDLPDIVDPMLTTEFVGPLYPSFVGSGFPVLDQVLQAAVTGDPLALLAFLPTPEDAVDTEDATTTPTATPAPADEQLTTTPSATPSPAPEVALICSSPLVASSLPAYMDEFLSPASAPEAGTLRLYAVVRGPFGADGSPPPWVAVLAFKGGDARQLWVSPEGDITHFAIGCPGAPPGVLLHVVPGDPYFWLRPVAPEPVHPIDDA